MQEKIDRLMTLVEQLRNGEELKAMLARAEKAEKMVADLIASDRSMRGQIYGTKSQKRRKDDNDENNDASRDAQSEKDSMGGKDSVSKLPESDPDVNKSETDTWIEENYRAKRAYREGSKNRTMKAARRCVHESDINAIPEGWTLIREEKRFAYDKMTVIVEHEYRYFIVTDPEGKEHVLYLPTNEGEEKWIETRDGEETEIQPAAPVNNPLKDKDGNHIIDCFPHTHATSGMMAQLVIDHFVNNIPYYRLSRYFWDNGMSVSRQTLINWLYEGGVELQKLIPILLDMAVEKDSIVNCDETWCKVRVKGKYAKRYIWCLVNKELNTVIYFYKKGARSRDALKSILDGRYPKALQSDGYNVYLYLDDALIDTDHRQRRHINGRHFESARLKGQRMASRSSTHIEHTAAAGTERHPFQPAHLRLGAEKRFHRHFVFIEQRRQDAQSLDGTLLQIISDGFAHRITVGRNNHEAKIRIKTNIDKQSRKISFSLPYPHRCPICPALWHFNVFNFPLHFKMLKYRLQVTEKKKSLLQF